MIEDKTYHEMNTVNINVENEFQLTYDNLSCYSNETFNTDFKTHEKLQDFVTEGKFHFLYNQYYKLK